VSTFAQVVSAVLERLDVQAIHDLYKAIISLHSPRVLYALSSASEKLVLFIMVRAAAVLLPIVFVNALLAVRCGADTAPVLCSQVCTCPCARKEHSWHFKFIRMFILARLGQACLGPPTLYVCSCMYLFAHFYVQSLSKRPLT